MDYEFSSVFDGSELLEKIEAKFNVRLSDDQTSPEFKNALLDLSECNLQPASAKLLAEIGLEVMDCALPLYYFSDIDGFDFILLKADSETMPHSSVITVSATQFETRNYLDDFFDDYIKYLESKGRSVNPCERYVIEQAQFWDVEDDYNAILSYYGMADCIVTTDYMAHDEIAVWVEYSYHSIRDTILSSGYIKKPSGEPILFATVADAQAKINKMKSELVMFGTDIKQPDYYITTTYPNN